MADHLVSVSVLVASDLNADVVQQVRPEYGLYNRLFAQLQEVQASVGAARIVVFDRLGNLVFDTKNTDAFGLPYARLVFDRDELKRVWEGFPTHSVAFHDADGDAFQTGYAPLLDGERVVAVVAVDLGVGFIGAVDDFRKSVYLLGGIGVLLTVIVGIVLSKTLTRPIDQLVKSAQVIGQGELSQRVEVSSPDELGVLGETLDVMRQQLAARDEQLRQMLAGVAHEIRNPLGGIELYASFIADDLDEGDPRREHILKVISEVRNLNQVISDFLVFARPALLQAEDVLLKEIVEDALFLLAPEMAQVGVIAKTDLETTGLLAGDGAQLKGAVVNVMKNGIQAMKTGGELEVNLSNMGQKVCLEIVDTGKGIAEDDKKRILEPFFTTKEQGSGLGLAIVQQVVGQHNGVLEIESELGVGTTVRMIFEGKL